MPATDPPEYDELPPYPEPIDPARLPEHLRGNPIAKLHMALPPEKEAMLARLAALDDEDAAEVARELLAGTR